MFVTDHFPALGFQTRRFFIPKATMKTKCKCGDVFGFKVSEAMKFIGCQVWRVIRVKINNANFSLPLLSNCNSCRTIS